MRIRRNGLLTSTWKNTFDIWNVSTVHPKFIQAYGQFSYFGTFENIVSKVTCLLRCSERLLKNGQADNRHNTSRFLISAAFQSG